MAYSGFLVKVGEYTIPLKFMAAESYSVGYHGQDLDSYRDADGDLHRTALQNFVPKIEFQTPALLTNTEVKELMNGISSNYINATEKKVSATVYIPESDSYVTQNMYVPDIDFNIYYADSKVIKFNSLRIALIGYGKGV